MTTIYWQCSSCKHQKKIEMPIGKPFSFGGQPCEKCGGDRSSVKMGGAEKPSWWDESKEQVAQ